MIFMGAMFFRVPSGLCLYFIATNVWSMTERWLFEHLKKNPSSVELILANGQLAAPVAVKKPDPVDVEVGQRIRIHARRCRATGNRHPRR